MLREEPILHVRARQVRYQAELRPDSRVDLTRFVDPIARHQNGLSKS
jgi:hypothetical protein